MRFLSLCGCFAPTKDTENAHTMSNVNYSFYRLVKNINRRAWNRACYRTWAVRFVSSHSFESVKLFASTWVTILLRAGDGTYVECVTNVKLVLYGNGWAASPHWKLSDACDFVAFTYIRRVSAFKTFSLTRPGGRYRPHRKGVTTIFLWLQKKWFAGSPWVCHLSQPILDFKDGNLQRAVKACGDHYWFHANNA